MGKLTTTTVRACCFVTPSCVVVASSLVGVCFRLFVCAQHCKDGTCRATPTCRLPLLVCCMPPASSRDVFLAYFFVGRESLSGAMRLECWLRCSSHNLPFARNSSHSLPTVWQTIRLGMSVARST